MIKSILHLSWLNLQNKYEGTFLGVIWHFFWPFLNYLLLIFIFQKVMKLHDPGMHARLLLCMTAWSFFKECTSTCSSLLIFKWNFVKNHNIPLIKAVLSEQIASLFTFLFNLLLSFTYLAVFGKFHLEPFSFIISALALTLVTFGFGMILCVIGTVLVDTFHLWNAISSVLFWALPIIYRPSQLPPEYAFLGWLNPFYKFFENYSLSIEGPVSPLSLALSICAGTALVFAGAALIKRKRNRIILSL